MSCCHTEHGCDEHPLEHSHSLGAWKFVVLVGLVLLANSFIATMVFDQEVYGELCAMASAILLGLPLVVAALKELAAGHAHLDELAALAVVACFAIEDYKTASIVALLMLAANLIESSRAKGAYDAIESLVKLAPSTASVRRDGALVSVDVKQLALGDMVQVLPGDNFPVDGKIKKGETTINESSITGESLPVEKSAEQEVFAGTTNLTGAVEIEVTKIGEQTMLGTVQNLILDASRTKVAVAKIVDEYVRWYTPLVLMVCSIILFFTENMYAAITALVVMCPCAFILATPTAMVAALSGAAKAGVLVKNAVDLENASNLTAIVFDKTGTLTTGNLEVFRLNPVGMDAARFLTTLASLEQNSRHPTARAVVEASRRANLALREAQDVTEAHGKGVKGTFDGLTVIIGRDAWLVENGVTVPDVEGDTAGASILHMAIDGVYAGSVFMADKMRAEAKEAADELRALNINQLTMLTGDRWEVARDVAAQLGFKDVEAQCLPETKLRLVEELKAKGHTVAVVGDGINDAPALAAGDMGIAMGGLGSDVAIHSASITFMSNDLRRLPFLIRLSKKTRKIIYQNFFFGILFIITGTSMAVFNYLSPIQAALLHNVGSFFVIFNSFRLFRVEVERD